MTSSTTSLAYRALDAQVIGGHADDPALEHEGVTLSYAQLLHESASVAGAFHQLGIEHGAPVVLDGLDVRSEIVAVLALARIGALPADEADARLTGRPAVLSVGDQDPVAWEVLIHAGRTDPAPAPPLDAEGFEDVLVGAYPEIFSTLLAGGTLS